MGLMRGDGDPMLDSEAVGDRGSVSLGVATGVATICGCGTEDILFSSSAK